MPTAREIHAQSEKAREANKLDLALDLIREAILQYKQEEDLAGQAEALCSKFLALKHKYRKTKQREDLIDAEQAIEEAINITEELEDKSGLVIPLINRAKFLEELGRSTEAIPYYQKAAKLNKETKLANHDQDLLAVDIELHLSLAEIETEPKELNETALSIVETALEDLNSGKENRDSFRVNVLISGAYLGLAKYFQNINQSESQKYLQLAKDLINSDERLVLRKKQLEKLKDKLNLE